MRILVKLYKSYVSFKSDFDFFYHIEILWIIASQLMN